MPEETKSHWTSVNANMGLAIGAISLVLTVLTADFMKPAVRPMESWLGVFFTAFVVFGLWWRRAYTHPLSHWLVATPLIGWVLILFIILFENISSLPTQPNLGLLAQFNFTRAVQLNTLHLDSITRRQLEERSSTETKTEVPKVIPEVVPVEPKPDSADQILLKKLKTALASGDVDAKEAAAQDAIASAKDPGTFRVVLHELYRSNDSTLRAMAILRALKSLEGRSVPITVISKAREDGDPNPNTSADKLAPYLIGSSLSITSVDLRNSNFAGNFNTGHSAAFTGTVDAAGGLQISTAVTGPGFGAFALQINVTPSSDLRLIGEARGNLNGLLASQVQVGLPI